MSDEVHCDCCKTRGRRRRMYPCPDDWFYLEAKDTESTEEDAIIVYACSKACALLLWQKGPGPRFELGEPTLNRL